ncbi:MAG: penicillin-binding protein 2 [Candidatus Eisenbacteria bacterium]|uniref:Penicillin-binding protein 2 n=1 Tax=Eiseniibacteriota bacterium TaxID=2212470 RepID=A0A849SKV6_UNCEI|nr:penicillin-binding protein 2 [Candidatus Eisenbacteria bacterium]
MPRPLATRFDRDGRLGVVAAIGFAGFTALTIALLRLQVVEHDEYRRLAQENRVRLEVLRAPRGAIFDRNGLLLADNRPSFNIVFKPFPAESVERVRTVVGGDWLERVSEAAGVDTGRVRALVRFANRSGQSALIRRAAPFHVVAAVEEGRADLPGLEVVIEPARHYPNGTLAAHLLGYAGQIGETELDSLSDQGYRSGDLIGRSGVERSFESSLRGRDGAEYVIVNAMGKRVSTLSEGPPQPPERGRDLQLTLDLKVQRAMEDAMANVERGAAVALDPRDGSVLAMVSRPTFDPNEFASGISFARWREMSAGGAFPLLNRAIQGAYPPGSTFKIVTMLAALEAGVAEPGTHFAPCHGGIEFGGRWFGCWNKRGHGSLDFVGALQHSCDVYYYQVGPSLGLERLGAMARAFGLGDRTGIDLPQERRGLVPNSAWYVRRLGKGGESKGVMLNLAIGQGELLVSPLQLALMAALTSTRGRAVRPHVVRQVVGEPALSIAKPVGSGPVGSVTHWDAVQRGLELVVSSGTGTAARVTGITVAGKTGTAQNPHGEDHALFVCYAPADHPEIAMAFVIENSGHGGSVAAPLAGSILRMLYAPDSVRVGPPARPLIVVPDSLRGLDGD